MQSDQDRDVEEGGRGIALDVDHIDLEAASSSYLILKDENAISPGVEISSLIYQRVNNGGKPLASHSSERKPNLNLQVPQRSVDISQHNAQSTPTPGSSKATKIPNKRLQSRLSLRSRSSAQSMKKGSTIPKSPSQGALESQTSLTSPYSFSRLVHTLSGRTSSLPVTQLREITTDETQGSTTKPLSKGKFARSLSVPANKIGSLKRTGGTSGFTLLVKPVLPCPSVSEAATDSKDGAPTTTTSQDGESEDGEKISEEEAVCRICFDELCEGGPTLKMECSCKGELALAHEDCALKWFSIKGNPTCDVCGKEVKNLPVMITRFPNETTNAQQQQSRMAVVHRIWQDIPVLVMISMLGYFCVLEQLLASTMGATALAIALPFACILGLLASITASTLVSRKYIWAYAVMQLSLVILLSHVFYSVVRLQAVLSILLAALAGFGIAMSINAIILEYVSWRKERTQRLAGSAASAPEATEVQDTGGNAQHDTHFSVSS
ncbi:hypothetical protein O6H91_17G065100 [Diphasiastrum complanatum]|uniref:Uncharacterized protein n=1 Tax=Diphasiastrum complanatum TaxID=34168 RepID=A0ACC2B7N5_DIPCM|nr:hypothetical protein O6H91_17G065100 [Diphasiastrum complanatum]